MLNKKDFYLKTESGKKIPSNKVKIVSSYSPSYRLQVKDPELDEGPFRVLAIKCYKLTFDGYGEMFANIIENLSEHGHVEERFYNTLSNENLFIEDIYFGEVRHSGDFDSERQK